MTLKIKLEKLIKEFNINTTSTEELNLDDLLPTTKVFKARVDLWGDIYIIDTIEGKEIACCPHIVDRQLEKLATIAAKEAIKVIDQIENLSNKKVVFEHVLRAAPGYKLDEAYKNLIGKNLFEVYVRPQYLKPSFRAHDEADLKIIYEDFNQLPHCEKIFILKPDTEATGRTGRLALQKALEECKKRKTKIEKVILYGFIAYSGLKLISEFLKEKRIALSAYAIGNITPLASNGYDMILYGVDESYYANYGKIKKLGAIVDRKTLESYITTYIPGLDQPGDWSARQHLILTEKNSYEENKNAIVAHLKNSIKIINKLRQISNFSEWQEMIAITELAKLEKTLRKYENSLP